MKTLHPSWSAVRSFFHEKQLSFSNWTLLSLSGILLFVYSLPHAIALRKFLLLIVFLISFKFFWKALLKKPKPLLPAVLIFVFLQVWMLVIAGLVSNDPYSSFSEWKGQWLPVLMSFVVGIGLAGTLMQSRLKDPRAAAAMLILIPITLFLIVNAMAMIHDMILAGTFLSNQLGITDQKGISNYLIALLQPILIADMLSRLVKGNRLLPVPGWVISAILILALFTLFANSSRNGLVIMSMTFVLGAGMMILDIGKVYSPKKVIASVLATLIFVLAIALAEYKINPRWQNFIETVPIAWDIDRDLLWLNGDDASAAPLTPSGQPVEFSAYGRIAWAREGWRMLMAHPWGTEIARGVFYKLELAKHGHAGMSHSHNSWIDLGLQVGFPGLLLWGWLLLLLAQFGWRAWRAQNDLLGLALAILVIMLAVRGLLDSIFRDHEIEQFMLVAGLLFSTLSFGNTNIHQTRL